MIFFIYAVIGMQVRVDVLNVYVSALKPITGLILNKLSLSNHQASTYNWLIFGANPVQDGRHSQMTLETQG